MFTEMYDYSCMFRHFIGKLFKTIYLAVAAKKAATGGNMKKPYNITKKLVGKYSKPEIQIKDKKSMAIIQIQEQRKRWGEHFEVLLNKSAAVSPLGIKTTYVDFSEDVTTSDRRNQDGHQTDQEWESK